MLDCETERGQGAIASVNRMVDCLSQLKRCDFRNTSKTCPYDYWMVSGGKLVGIAECKSRQMSLEQLREFGSYLITAEKLELGIRAAKALGVPFYVIVLLEHSDMVAAFKICNHKGEPQCRWEVRETDTRATINGGTATRLNAYIDLSNVIFRKL